MTWPPNPKAEASRFSHLFCACRGGWKMLRRCNPATYLTCKACRLRRFWRTPAEYDAHTAAGVTAPLP